MEHDKTLFFAGIDWGSVSHQVCVIDQDGFIVGEEAFDHTGKGLCEMAEWMLRISETITENVAVSIEVTHGPVVESLLERGFFVYSINPKQLDRFRDRFSPSGAKDDRRDAQVLAEALRTDSRHLRRVKSRDPDVTALRELLRTREELVGERVRLINRMRQLLWSYYPQFNEVIGDDMRPWLVELWELVPTPAAARKIRRATIGKLLKHNRIRRIDAEGILKVLRSVEISVQEAIVSSRVAHIRVIAERMKIVDHQLSETEGFIDDTINIIASRQNNRSGQEARPSDIEILRSIPGVGMVVLGTLLGEAYELLCRRDYRSLRCFAGTAPVTRQSGKSRYVMGRRAASRRLTEAIYHLARVAVLHDPVSRARYKSLRAKGLGHARSLRTVGDRLLLVCCSLLRKGEMFDKEFKKVPEAAAA